MRSSFEPFRYQYLDGSTVLKSLNVVLACGRVSSRLRRQFWRDSQNHSVVMRAIADMESLAWEISSGLQYCTNREKKFELDLYATKRFTAAVQLLERWARHSIPRRTFKSLGVPRSLLNRALMVSKHQFELSSKALHAVQRSQGN